MHLIYTLEKSFYGNWLIGGGLSHCQQVRKVDFISRCWKFRMGVVYLRAWQLFMRSEKMIAICIDALVALCESFLCVILMGAEQHLNQTTLAEEIR
jgi:hypothetical protein